MRGSGQRDLEASNRGLVTDVGRYRHSRHRPQAQERCVLTGPSINGCWLLRAADSGEPTPEKSSGVGVHGRGQAGAPSPSHPHSADHPAAPYPTHARLGKRPHSPQLGVTASLRLTRNSCVGLSNHIGSVGGDAAAAGCEQNAPFSPSPDRLSEASGLLNAPQVGESTDARPLNDLKRSAPRRGDQLIGIAFGQGTSYSQSHGYSGPTPPSENARSALPGTLDSDADLVAAESGWCSL